MNQAEQHEIDERTNLISSNKFELLLFRLGEDERTGKSEIFGINVFKIREIVAMPEITQVAGAPMHNLGVVNLRGQVIPVIDLPSVVGRKPAAGLNIMLVTEFARTTQAFAVESVDEIVRLDWSNVLSAENRTGGELVTSIARLDGASEETRLALVLDVESILRKCQPETKKDIDHSAMGSKLLLKPGQIVLAADDSGVARALIGQSFDAINAPHFICKTGKECWEKLQVMYSHATSEGKSIHDLVAMVLTDLEMPEMDGFTLTRNIKHDDRFKNIPVVIHSSLSGTTNEEHVRKVGADAYVAKFVAEELAETIRKVTHK